MKSSKYHTIFCLAFFVLSQLAFAVDQTESDSNSEIPAGSVSQIDFHNSADDAKDFVEKVLEQSSLSTEQKQGILERVSQKFGTTPNILMTRITYLGSALIATGSEVYAAMTIEEYHPSVISTLFSATLVGYTAGFEGVIQKFGDQYTAWINNKSWNPFNLSEKPGGVTQSFMKRLSVSMVFASSLNLLAIGSGTLNTDLSTTLARSAFEGAIYISSTQYFFEFAKKYSQRSDISEQQRSRMNEVVNFGVTMAANFALLVGKIPVEFAGGHALPEGVRNMLWQTDPNALSVGTSVGLFSIGAIFYYYQMHREWINLKVQNFKSACKTAFGFKLFD